MKGHTSAKRRLRGVPLVVPMLVILSLLVPLLFLLRLSPYGDDSDDSPALESGFVNYVHLSDSPRVGGFMQDNRSVQNLLKSVASSLSKDITQWNVKQNARETDDKNLIQSDKNVVQLILQPGYNSYNQPKFISTTTNYVDFRSSGNKITSHSRGSPNSQHTAPLPFSSPNARKAGEDRKKNINSSDPGIENEKSCQMKFGSYCIWSLQHKAVMKDNIVKKLKDQVFVARAYYPSIAKLKGQDNLAHELKQNIQDHERMLSDATVDADLPQLYETILEKMEHTIAKAKSYSVDCSNVEKKLRQILGLSEGEAHFHTKQSAFIYHLSAETMPKTHHCLSMRLTVEFFISPPFGRKDSLADQVYKQELRHVVIFSQNILAASAVIRSTVANSKETGDMVFHLLTDVQYFYAMKHWFSRNTFKDATVHVLNLDELCNNLSMKSCISFSPSEEFRISIQNNEQLSSRQTRTEYLSIFGSSLFLLPEIFMGLKKVVVLDDDVIVQRDLEALWNIKLGSRVIGAVELCRLKLYQLKSHLRGHKYKGESCAWMSGVSIVDLVKWKEHNVSGSYQRLVQELGSSRPAGALLATLLAFQDLVYPLDDSWMISGLGYDYGISSDSISKAAVVHYNGNMKPWLELGIPYYKGHWKKYLPQNEHFMHECNLSP